MERSHCNLADQKQQCCLTAAGVLTDLSYKLEKPPLFRCGCNQTRDAPEHFLSDVRRRQASFRCWGEKQRRQHATLYPQRRERTRTTIILPQVIASGDMASRGSRRGGSSNAGFPIWVLLSRFVLLSFSRCCQFVRDLPDGSFWLFLRPFTERTYPKIPVETLDTIRNFPRNVGNTALPVWQTPGLPSIKCQKSLKGGAS